MTSSDNRGSRPPPQVARNERLEDQLRANLKRRKDAARARRAGADAADQPPAASTESGES